MTPRVADRLAKPVPFTAKLARDPRHIAMPVNILAQVFAEGLGSIPYGWEIAKATSVFAVLYLLKWYFNGAVNGSERNMHSKVIMVTVSLAIFNSSQMGNLLTPESGRNSWHRR